MIDKQDRTYVSILMVIKITKRIDKIHNNSIKCVIIKTNHLNRILKMELHSENNYLKKKKDKYLAVDKWLISKQLKQMN